jgi:hypothetical protein
MSWFDDIFSAIESDLNNCFGSIENECIKSIDKVKDDGNNSIRELENSYSSGINSAKNELNSIKNRITDKHRQIKGKTEQKITEFRSKMRREKDTKELTQINKKIREYETKLYELPRTRIFLLNKATKKYEGIIQKLKQKRNLKYGQIERAKKKKKGW